ncbi:polyhydroxyalkanoate granule-associated phasin [Cupriavidus necator]|uniref:polyhydroxyalkanoate granule-associated phasin n=1 Tax=Cupriavidus necator TaxID=106590 RepID=UPI00149071F7|nr:polyhydroxyalkanoate granule-associated phasin [Cupriavidus necator]NOV24811.1 phasin family protein [Cupriavidus necator]
MMTATQIFWPLGFWPLPAVFPGMQQVETMQAELAGSWRRMAELNLDFTRTMFEEIQFDAMGALMEPDPEARYAREIAGELPLLGGPLHYASAMLELYARAQQKWIDGWGHLLTRGLGWDWQGLQQDVVDIPFWLVRETPGRT